MAAGEPMQIVVLGDSLSAGLGLPADQAYPARLEAALRAKGYDVRVINAGVSGDTSSAGLARLDWAVPKGADAVILELGGNDALRGVPLEVTYKALDEIVRRLKERNVEVLIAGMRAPRNLGPEYTSAFDAIYPELADAHGVALVPFFLDGVAADPKLNLPDGIHPNAEGVTIVVQNTLAAVESLVVRARSRKAR
jgi:acyl-CoA thioesterase-1